MGHNGLRDLARQSVSLKDLSQALVQIRNDILQEEIRTCINMRNRLQAILEQRESNACTDTHIYTHAETRCAKSIQQLCRGAYPIMSIVYVKNARAILKCYNFAKKNRAATYSFFFF